MADNTVFTFRYEGDNPPQGGNTSGQAQGLPILSPKDFREQARLSIEELRARKIAATERVQDRKRRRETDVRLKYLQKIRDARAKPGGATDAELDEIRKRRGYELSRVKKHYDVLERGIVQKYDNMMRLERKYRSEEAKSLQEHQNVVLSRVRRGYRQKEAEDKKADSKALQRAGRRRRLLRARGRKQRKREDAAESDVEKKAEAYRKRRAKVLAARSKATRDRNDRNDKQAERDAEAYNKRRQRVLAARSKATRDRNDRNAKQAERDAEAARKLAERNDNRQERDEKQFRRDKNREITYSRIAARIFRTYLVREFGGHRAGRINAAGEAAQEAALRIGPTALGRMLAGFGTAAKVVGTGAALANVAVQLARLPERLAAMTRGISESNGGPSLSRIEMFSPQAALARAAQARTSTFGALESSRTIGTAMAARINAETRLAEASRRASDRLYNAATPIYVWAKDTAATAIEAIAGTYNPSKNPRNELIQYGYAKFAQGKGNWWQNEEMLRKLDAFEYGKRIFALEDWAKQARADELRNTASRMGFLPFPEKMIEPIQFEEFRDGVINAKTGMRDPPIWVDDSLLGF